MDKKPSGDKAPFPQIKMNIKPMLTLMGVAIALLAALLVLLPADTQDAARLSGEGQAVSQDATRADADCTITQTIGYERCGHEVTRRQVAPTEVAGKTLTETQPLYEDWTITEFAPKSIIMKRTLSLFCPEHLVLMPDSSGMLCVFQNTYGDAMGLVRELDTPFDALSSAMQEEVRSGMGFMTLAELEGWLESAES